MKKFKVLALPLALTVVLLGSASEASAALDGYVTKDAEGKSYYYDYVQLKTGLAKSLTNPNAPEAQVWQHFKNKKTEVLALHDTEKGYIDYKDVRSALLKAATQGKQFDVMGYISGGQAAPAMQLPSTLNKVKVNNGQLDDSEVVDVGDSDNQDFGVISID